MNILMIGRLPEKEDFYSLLNIEDITDADYMHAKGVCKDFEIKNIRGTSWFVCSKRYLIVSQCVWELSKYVPWEISPWPCLFSYHTRINMASRF